MRALGLLVALGAGLLWAPLASAQYLDPPAPGYLPAASRGPVVDSPLFEDEGPLVSVGGAFDLGIDVLNTSAVDADYFAVNEAHELGGMPVAGGNFELWLTIHHHLRLGLDTGFGSGGDGRATASLSGGGLLVEGGGFVPYSPWGFWGGAVLGRGRMALETDDEPGNFYTYEASYNRIELQGHAQVQIAPSLALRGSIHYTHGWVVDDEITAGIRDDSDIVPLLPADVVQPLDAVGITLGFVLGR